MIDKMALGQVFLRVVRFALSVPFHQCFVLIHVTDALKRAWLWNIERLCLTSGFRRCLNGDQIPTFRDNLWVLSSRVKQSEKNCLSCFGPFGISGRGVWMLPHRGVLRVSPGFRRDVNEMFHCIYSPSKMYSFWTAWPSKMGRRDWIQIFVA